MDHNDLRGRTEPLYRYSVTFKPYAGSLERVVTCVEARTAAAAKRKAKAEAKASLPLAEVTRCVCIGRA